MDDLLLESGADAPELEQVLVRVASGELLSDVCGDPALPNMQEVHRALMSDPLVFERYLNAQRLRTLNDLDRLQMIADADQLVLVRTEVVTDLETGESSRHDFFEREEVQRSRLRVDTIKWRAERLFPGDSSVMRSVDHQDRGSLRSMLLEATNSGHGLPSELEGTDR